MKKIKVIVLTCIFQPILECKNNLASDQRGHKWITKEVVKIDALSKTAEMEVHPHTMVPKGEV